MFTDNNLVAVHCFHKPPKQSVDSSLHDLSSSNNLVFPLAAPPVWCPYKQGDIKELEKIQKRATKLVINLKKIPYKDRLMHLKLPTLKYRRLRGDMIEVFKITHNIYDSEVSLELRYYSKSNTRGNKYKLLNHTFHYDTRKFSFSARIVNIWNSLPNFVVDDFWCRYGLSVQDTFR